jgi:hypothetical protein
MQERKMNMKTLTALLLSTTLLASAAHANPPLNAPYTKLQYGQELCEAAGVAPGDPFYKQCKACEKNTSACSGDLRDRARMSPYYNPDSYLVTATSSNNENAAIIFSRKSRKKAIEEALKECRAGGRFICKDEVGWVLVHSYRNNNTDVHMSVDENTCVYFARSKKPIKSGDVYWLAQAPSPKEAQKLCSVDKWGGHHECIILTGMCTGK